MVKKTVMDGCNKDQNFWHIYIIIDEAYILLRIVNFLVLYKEKE